MTATTQAGGSTTASSGNTSTGQRPEGGTSASVTADGAHGPGPGISRTNCRSDTDHDAAMTANVVTHEIANDEARFAYLSLRPWTRRAPTLRAACTRSPRTAGVEQRLRSYHALPHLTATGGSARARGLEPQAVVTVSRTASSPARRNRANSAASIAEGQVPTKLAASTAAWQIPGSGVGHQRALQGRLGVFDRPSPLLRTLRCRLRESTGYPPEAQSEHPGDTKAT